VKLCLAISVLFAVVFTITGATVQFFPLFLNQTGLSSQQISLAMSFLALSKILSTFFVAFFIDRSPKPNFFLAFTTGLTALV
jgi:cyanate permease